MIRFGNNQNDTTTQCLCCVFPFVIFVGVALTMAGIVVTATASWDDSSWFYKFDASQRVAGPILLCLAPIFMITGILLCCRVKRKLQSQNQQGYNGQPPIVQPGPTGAFNPHAGTQSYGQSNLGPGYNRVQQTGVIISGQGPSQPQQYGVQPAQYGAPYPPQPYTPPSTQIYNPPSTQQSYPESSLCPSAPPPSYSSVMDSGIKDEKQ